MLSVPVYVYFSLRLSACFCLFSLYKLHCRFHAPRNRMTWTAGDEQTNREGSGSASCSFTTARFCTQVSHADLPMALFPILNSKHNRRILIVYKIPGGGQIPVHTRNQKYDLDKGDTLIERSRCEGVVTAFQRFFFRFHSTLAFAYHFAVIERLINECVIFLFFALHLMTFICFIMIADEMHTGVHLIRAKN